MRHLFVAWMMLAVTFASPLWAGEQYTPEKIQGWRKEGPPAVERLMLERSRLLVTGAKLSDDAKKTYIKELESLNDVIDQVAAAKYSHESGLYWYTDEKEAEQQAKKQKKPILTLRLLGNLNEELTCANSRYFRVLLYPNEIVRKLLHDKFILHWKSVRPVPLITIDLGDGRKIERTISGNSVHYVLMPDGTVVDVFPGLYGPKLFAKRLDDAREAVQKAIGENNPIWMIKSYRKEQLAALESAWNEDLKKFYAADSTKKESKVTAVGKPPEDYLSFWETIAAYHKEFGEFDQAAERLIRQEADGILSRRREARDAVGGDVDVVNNYSFAWAKGGSESVLEVIMKNCLRSDLAADSVFNEYHGRYQALQTELEFHVNEINSHVYEHVFGYSLSDPWLGISHRFAALPRGGGLKFELPNEKPVPRPSNGKRF